MLGYLQKGMQISMAQGRSTTIISTIKWIRTSRSSIKNSLYHRGREEVVGEREYKYSAGPSIMMDTLQVRLL